MDNKLTRRPVVDPLLLALRSRRVMIALSALIVGLLVIAFPALAAVRGEILTLLITLALAVIGGYSVEDAARAARERPEPDTVDLARLIREAVDAALDELGIGTDGEVG
jgi:hypothetical protein